MPDICVTQLSNHSDLRQHGWVLDLAPYLEEYKYLPDLWEWLGEENLYWNQDQ